MDSELLLKFIGYFPDYLSALSRTLLLSFSALTLYKPHALEQLTNKNVPVKI